MRYVRDSIYVIGVKPIAEFAYPRSDLHDVSRRVERDGYAILNAPCRTE